MTGRTVAAVDLGAESARVAAVTLTDGRLEFRLASRTPNVPEISSGQLSWNMDSLWQGVSDGLAKLTVESDPIASVGVDSWGVDYGLLDEDGTPVRDPVCYRDGRNAAQLARALARVGARNLYLATGCQIHEVNSVFGLMDDAANHPLRLESARKMLMMADLFANRLSGSTVTERSLASTTGCFDMATASWAVDLLDRVGVPTHMLPDVVAAGTDAGPLTGVPRTGALRHARVILPAAHDTASAVLAVPSDAPGEGYISSGTWSLVGVLAREPVITEESFSANLTNEGGYQGTIRLLRNITGLWMLQACRAQWSREGTARGYDQLADAASRETPLRSIINPNAAEFLAPGDLPARIRRYCLRNGEPVPETIGQTARCVVDSLALAYRLTFEDIARVTGHSINAVNVVGGGVRHTLLQQATADAVGVPVRCGSPEAAALGNAAAQLVCLGELTATDIPALMRAGSEVRTYEPLAGADWEAAAARLRLLIRCDDAGRGTGGPGTRPQTPVPITQHP
jgi:rhamnulokinase